MVGFQVRPAAGLKSGQSNQKNYTLTSFIWRFALNRPPARKPMLRREWRPNGNYHRDSDCGIDKQIAKNIPGKSGRRATLKFRPHCLSVAESFLLTLRYLYL